VPAGANLTIVFPSQFNFSTTAPTVSSVLINDAPAASFSFSVLSNNLTINNAVPTTTAVANVTITADNVLNPSPALTTSPFLIQIGADYSDISSSSSITLTAATFNACSLTFSPSYVNTTGAMVVSLTPRNPLHAGDYITISFPSTLQWSEDLSTSHTLPLGSVLSCAIVAGAITGSSCLGQASTASVTFALTSINGSSLSSAFSFTVSSLFSPPTTNPPDTLAISSVSSSNYPIDTCTTPITSL
jgi:hypothetical protein